MAVCAYLFEAKQLQSYIFLTGKLRDTIGASELVNRLCFLHDERLAGDAADLARDANLSAKVQRAAGGVMVLTTPSENRAQMILFRAMWRMAVAQRAPGLNFVDGLGISDTASADVDLIEAAVSLARQDMASAGPRPLPDAPLASPLIRPAPRSGLGPAVQRGWTRNGRCRITKEFADLGTLSKRQALARGDDTLANRFAGVQKNEFRWPIVFEGDEKSDGEVVFPFPGDERTIALVHIDGNDIGTLFQRAGLSPDERRVMSNELSSATSEAARAAMKPILAAAVEKVVPARPVVLGGDDLTLIVRADLAFEFVTNYLSGFEAATKTCATLTTQRAKAGIVFMGARQPFAQAYELCEALSSSAKCQDQSRLSFWRLTHSVIPRSIAELRLQTETDQPVVLWKSSWDLGRFRNLEDLADILEKEEVGRGAMRQVPDILMTDKRRAHELFERALKALSNRSPQLRSKFDAAMTALGVPAESLIDDSGYCPLLDAHQIVQIRKVGRA